MLTERSPAVKAFPVMIIFIIYNPACLELSATHKYSANVWEEQRKSSVSWMVA